MAKRRICFPHEDAPDHVWDAFDQSEEGQRSREVMELTDLEFETLADAADCYDRFLVFAMESRASTDAERELARIRRSALESGIVKVTKEHVNP